MSYPAYVDANSRPLPEIVSYSPNQGSRGTKVTVYFRSVFDLDDPQVTPMIMFGSKRCESLLTKTTEPGSGTHQYALSAEAPPLTPTTTPSPEIPLCLTFEDSPVTWTSPLLEFGGFTYLDQASHFFNMDSPQLGQKKRKLSPEASPRRSPAKKAPLQQLPAEQTPFQIATPSSPFRQACVSDMYSQTRRISGPAVPQYRTDLSRPQPAASQPYYGAHATPSMHVSPNPLWGNMHSANRSPPTANMVATSRGSLLPSPSHINRPPALVRTSALQHSPSASVSSTTQSFNPYAMYPSNSKAMLKIEGDLHTMTEKWSDTEWEARRRLVQFRRSQVGSVITATFDPVTLENREPNSICVSCIWWEERRECYVTSVDTISLLESLVAVRFTVEEKNRIRRNLEGFRPATVSKARAESENFFKLIMGFPNPKPRNIEKDVKVFPWRILHTALKKIIGKYARHPPPHTHFDRWNAPNSCVPADLVFPQSASYSSTAGALHHNGHHGDGPSRPGYVTGRGSDAGIDAMLSRPMASPHSNASSAASHGHAYVAVPTHYSPPHGMRGATGLGIGASTAGAPDLRLSVPVTAGHQTTVWRPSSSQQQQQQQQHQHYSGDLSAADRGSWQFPGAYATSTSPATGMPGSSYHYPYSPNGLGLTHAPSMPAEGRFVTLHEYEDHHNPGILHT